MSAPGEAPNRWVRLWARWVFANAVGEAAGLGLTALAGIAFISHIGNDASILVILALAALTILAGTLIEGTLVGTAQWLVLRRPLPGMRWRTWTVATGAGALVAWSLGMIPSTLLSLSADSSESAGAAGPSDAAVYALAFLMGLLLGPVLGFAQWLVLRRFVRRAGLWMPANALAWAFGMVVIFVGAGAVAEGGMGARTVVLIVALLACAGAVVGAVHGLALVRLLGMTGSGVAR